MALNSFALWSQCIVGPSPRIPSLGAEFRQCIKSVSCSVQRYAHSEDVLHKRQWKSAINPMKKY